jgi:hypothetical protein
MKTTAEKIAEYEQRAEALRAFERGEEVEVSPNCHSIDVGWVSARRHYIADWDLFHIRIKPKLIEGWVNVYSDGDSLGVHKSRYIADEHAGERRIRCVKVREVPDDE